MNTYCLKNKKDTFNVDPKMLKTKNNRLLMQSNVVFVRLKSQAKK